MSLNLIELHLDPRSFFEFVQEKVDYPSRQSDFNYWAHCALAENFGKEVPVPYCIEESDKSDKYRILAYSPHTSEELRDIAKLTSPDPKIYHAILWDEREFRSKPMPERFLEGLELHFELVTLPVVRLSSQIKVKDKKGERTFKKGAELDVYQRDKLKEPDGKFSRFDSYINWLSSRLDKRFGVELLYSKVAHYRLVQSSRRTQKRNGKKRAFRKIVQPEVRFKGCFKVVDSDLFQSLLAKGFGRQKSFGYGMVKIRRAR